MKTLELIKNIGKHLKTRRGLAILSVSSFLSYLILVLIDNLSLLNSYLFRLDLTSFYTIFTSLVTGYPGSVHIETFVITLLTSVLIGVNLALLSNTLSLAGGSGGFSGSFLGLALSGCAACTTSVISFAGISIGVGFLPYDGLELSILSIILLTGSALWISHKDLKEVCEI